MIALVTGTVEISGGLGVGGLSILAAPESGGLSLGGVVVSKVVVSHGLTVITAGAANIGPDMTGVFQAKTNRGPPAESRASQGVPQGRKNSTTKWDGKTNAKAELSYKFNGQRVIAYQDANGFWWAKDTTGHGGSAFKVFRKKGKELHWVADADEFGNFIVDKHKSQTGMVIKLD